MITRVGRRSSRLLDCNVTQLLVIALGKVQGQGLDARAVVVVVPGQIQGQGLYARGVIVEADSTVHTSRWHERSSMLWILRSLCLVDRSSIALA